MTFRSILRIALPALTAMVGLAQADTFLYSVTAGQLLNSLPAGYSGDSFGYFAFFVQPTVGTLATALPYGPATTSQNGWAAGLYTDPLTGICLRCDGSTWVAFGGSPADTGNTNVVVISQTTAFPHLTNYSDDAEAPIFWGPTGGNISGVMPLSSTFYFPVTIIDAPPAQLTMNAFATAIDYSSGGGLSTTKDVLTPEFQIQADQYVPEPSLFAVWVAILASLGVTLLRRRRIAD